jgi:hypothetical protein
MDQFEIAIVEVRADHAILTHYRKKLRLPEEVVI